MHRISRVFDRDKAGNRDQSPNSRTVFRPHVFGVRTGDEQEHAIVTTWQIGPALQIGSRPREPVQPDPATADSHRTADSVPEPRAHPAAGRRPSARRRPPPVSAMGAAESPQSSSRLCRSHVGGPPAHYRTPAAAALSELAQPESGHEPHADHPRPARKARGFHPSAAQGPAPSRSSCRPRTPIGRH